MKAVWLGLLAAGLAVTDSAVADHAQLSAPAQAVLAFARISTPPQDEPTESLVVPSLGFDLFDVKLLEKRLKEDPSLVERRGVRGRTLMQLAAVHGKLEVAKILRKYGAKVDEPMTEEPQSTPIQVSATEEMTKFLLKEGANPKRKNKHNWNALHSLIALGYQDAAPPLIEKFPELVTEPSSSLLGYPLTPWDMVIQIHPSPSLARIMLKNVPSLASEQSIRTISSAVETKELTIADEEDEKIKSVYKKELDRLLEIRSMVEEARKNKEKD